MGVGRPAPVGAGRGRRAVGTRVAVLDGAARLVGCVAARLGRCRTGSVARPHYWLADMAHRLVVVDGDRSLDRCDTARSHRRHLVRQRRRRRVAAARIGGAVARVPPKSRSRPTVVVPLGSQRGPNRRTHGTVGERRLTKNVAEIGQLRLLRAAGSVYVYAVASIYTS